MEELEDKIYDITSDVQDFLGDSEEFRINLAVELKKMEEFNGNLINVSSDEVTENAEQNLFMINKILTLIDEQKEKEHISPLNGLVRDFEEEIALQNEAKREQDGK